MKVRLTDRFVATVNSEGATQADYFDDAPKTRGLALRVSSTGRKVWTFHFTSPKDGNRARLTFGAYPAIGLGDARGRALEAHGYLNETPPRDPRDVLRDAADGAMTIKGLVDAYLDELGRRGRRSIAEIRRRFVRNVMPLIGNVKVADIHRRDINRVVDPIVRRGSPVEAARTFEDVRAAVRWGVSKGYLDANPIQGMPKPAHGAPRERELSDDEIRVLWNGLGVALPRSKACQRIIRLCLLTAQRVGEVSGMAPQELDLKTGIWTIPSERSKNGHEHKVPLSDAAIATIKEAMADAGDGAKFIFPNSDGEGRLPGIAVAHTIARAHAKDEKHPLGRFGIDHWTAHDLRRTAVSQMAGLGVAPIVLGHVINHRSVTRAGVTLAVYSQYDYAKEKRAALDAWAERLSGIVAGGSASVTPMRRTGGDSK